MKYFITEKDREGTYWHEWSKGPFDGVRFWKPDSLLISDEELVRLGLVKLFRRCIPDYDPLDIVEVTREQWDAVRELASETGGETGACIREAEAWVEETFRTHGVFTMIGM